jgi:hypothetical protein
MSNRFRYIKLNRAFALLWMLFFLSCATYHERAAKYYGYYSTGEWVKANKALESNRLLQSNRNQLLYFFEKGKLLHSMGVYDSSNYFFNLADVYMEDQRKTIGNAVVGTIMNPMMKPYQAEDFEQFMMHYYKALNYYYLGDINAALVEARRISLKEYALDDKYKRDKRYQQDAFSLIVQGIIYELSNDQNNAFISYRNAANLYIDNDGVYYNVTMPQQLQEDVLRTAYKVGFYDELSRYEGIFNKRFNRNFSEDPELILFVETGNAPVKVEKNLFFTMNSHGGDLFFADQNGGFNIPFNTAMMGSYSARDLNSLNIKSFRVAFPGYVERLSTVKSLSLQVDGTPTSLEKVEDINTLAFEVLRQRTVQELANTLSRLAVKKLIEEIAVKAAKEAAKKDSSKSQATAELVGLGIQLFSALSEKADTRNWQSLPHSIYYSRVKVKNDRSNIDVVVNGKVYHSFEFNAQDQLTIANYTITQ